MVDFNVLLAAPADSFKEPPTWPAGTYFGKISGFSTGQTKGGDGKEPTPTVSFSIVVTEAGPDIDQEDLSEIVLTNRKWTKDFYITPDATYRLVEFIKSLGVDTVGRAVKELLPETISQEVMVTITKSLSRREAGKFVNYIDKLTGKN